MNCFQFNGAIVSKGLGVSVNTQPESAGGCSLLKGFLKATVRDVMHVAVAIVALIALCLQEFSWFEVLLVIRWRFKNCGVEEPERARIRGDMEVELRDVIAETIAGYRFAGASGFEN